MNRFRNCIIATLAIVLAWCVQPADARQNKTRLVKDGAHRIYPGDGDYVVILHGWTTGYDNMRRLREHFSEAGYYVVGLRYPTRTDLPAELLKNHIEPAIEKYCTDDTRKIHFVTHSLGGLLLRDYLTDHRPETLGNVVMLAPPNNGIEIVDRLSDNRAFARFFGPMALELHTGEDGYPAKLAKPDYPVGIIMGDMRLRVPYTSRLLPGKDDGIVSSESGKLEGMRDLIYVPSFHTRISKKSEALTQAQKFIESGAFDKEIAKTERPRPVSRWVENIRKLRRR